MDFSQSVLETYPSVWAVGDHYQIFAPSRTSALMWVQVGNERYYDHANGILRSDTCIHKIQVPMKALDKAGCYTVFCKPMWERKPYRPVTGPEEQHEFQFQPLRSGNINIYHLADTHNRVESPVNAASYFGDELDLLILNGDIPNHSGEIENFKTIYEIAGKVTKGSIPVIFSRGNHDTRGFYAEQFTSYTPTDRGISYYTIRMGELWCLVLDTGEDKDDSHAEYGGTVCFHSFRQEETRFLEDVIRRAEQEYNAPGITKRIVISHTPFTEIDKPPFDIEQDIYRHWVQLISQHIRPDFYLCGHLHTCEVIRPGEERDAYGQSCPTVIGATPNEKDHSKFTACGISYRDDEIIIRFTDQDRKVLKTVKL